MSKKLVSWNVNGIRACVKKGFQDRLNEMDPDVIGLQETKAQDDQVIEALKSVDSYHLYCNSAVKKGYSGTAILAKEKPINVEKDMGIQVHDQEGRILAAEFEEYYYVTVYVPNSGQGLKRLDYRKDWDNDFQAYLQNLEKHKPLVACGDFNVAHQELDIARPKANYNKTAGYTQAEIDGMTNFLNGGLTDTFRHLYPDEVAYSWWSFRGGAREKNIGWRIDYFLTSEFLKNRIKEAAIHTDIHGSDHCPISLILS